MAEQLYGEDVFGIASDVNRYVGDTRWHPDTGSLDQYGVKFAYYLQPVTADTGALRLIPGSHESSFHGELRQKMDELELDIPDVPAYIFESEPGTWLPSMYDAGMRVGVARLIAGCVSWSTTTIQKHQRKRKSPKNRLSEMGLTMDRGLPTPRDIRSASDG